MTIKEARRLSVGDAVTFKNNGLHGIVIGIKLDAVRIQWRDGPALDVPFHPLALDKIQRSEP